MRPIDADELKKALDEQMNFDENCRDSVFDIIDNAPTIETTKAEYKAYNDGFKDGVDQGIKLSERPQGKWICPNCYLYEQVVKDYCPYAGECTIGCRECKYFKRKGGAE